MIKKIIAFLLVCFTLTGCIGSTAMETGGLEEETQNNNEEEAEAEDKSSEIIYISEDDEVLKLSMRMPETLNPLLNQDITVDRVLKLIFEPLVAIDVNQQPVPNIAKDMLFTEDGRTLVIYLRDDIYFTDGSKLNAEDVVFSLKTIQSAGENSLYKSALNYVQDFSELGSDKVQINYTKAYGGSLYNLCFPVIPKHYYQEASSKGSPVNLTPLGTGAYQYDTYVRSKSLKLIYNTEYFKGKPKIENINVLIAPDTQTDIYAFNEGVIDVLNTTMSQWGKHRGERPVSISQYTNDNYEFLGFNHLNIYLQDKAIRQAISMCVPTDSIVKNIYINNAQQAYTAVSPASYCFEPYSQKHIFNLEEARTIFESSGYSRLTFNILVNEENIERVKIAEIIQQNLSRAGIKANVNKKIFEEYEEDIKNGDYDMFVGGITMGIIPDIAFAFHSGGDKNVFNYKNSSMDIFITLANNSVGDEAYKSGLSEVQKLFSDDLPVVSLGFRKTAMLVNSRVKGEFKPLFNNPYANIYEWEIK